MPDFIILILTPAAILALVNLAKRLGLSGAWSALLAVILGIALHLAVWYWGAETWFSYAVQGLIAGLSAAGLYDVAGTVTSPDPRRSADDAYAVREETLRMIEAQRE
jgi:hypothetical protein